MSEVFLTLVNMSISASFLVLAALLLRPLIKKAPAWIACLVWGLAALRLILPVTFESGVSLVPSAETFPKEFLTAEEPRISTGVAFVNSAVNPVIGELLSDEPVPAPDQQEAAPQPRPAMRIAQVLSVVWIGGAAVMLGYAALSRIRLQRRVAASVEIEEGVFACDDIRSPFILGAVRPMIFVPSDMEGEALGFVLAHERAHIRRRDNLWKPLGFLLLTVYWFNPLLWLAYVLLCRDIELACDERVIRDMDENGRALYSQTLLDRSVRPRLVAVCPLAFGEVGVKARIKSVLNYRKPAFWVIIAALAACAVLAVCFLTNPKRGASGKVKCTYKADSAEREITIAREDGEFLLGLLESGWREGEAGGSCPYEFDAEGRLVRYDPDHGIFYGQDGSTLRSVTFDDRTRLNAMLGIENTIPFSLDNAEGHSENPSVRVGAARLSTSGQKELTVIWDNIGDKVFKFSEEHCLYRVGSDGSLEKAPVRRDVNFGFSATAYELFPKSFTLHTYNLNMYGELPSGKYRLYLNGLEPTDYRVDFEIVEDEERLAWLREEYPEYFGLEGNVLTIYAMDPGRGRYYLSARGDLNEQDRGTELAGKILERGVCADDMRLILSQYGTTPILTVVPVINPIRSQWLVYETAIAELSMELYGTAEYAPEEAAVRLEELRGEYPQLFGLPTEDGLEIYVCQFAPGSFRFMLLPAAGERRSPIDLMEYEMCPISSFRDMKLILSTYDIDDRDISVIPYQNLLSSYIPRNEPWYAESIRRLLGLQPLK